MAGKSLVAEARPEGREPIAVGEEPLPVVVPDLVPEVAEQGAIGLVELEPAPLALGIVRFGDVDRDHAVAVTRQHRHLLGFGEQVEDQATLGLHGLVRDRQAQP